MQSVTVTKVSLLIIFRNLIRIYCEIYIKYCAGKNVILCEATGGACSYDSFVNGHSLRIVNKLFTWSFYVNNLLFKVLMYNMMTTLK
jgi:hypothetical protein